MNAVEFLENIINKCLVGKYTTSKRKWRYNNVKSKQRDLIDRVLIHKYESWLTPEPKCNRFELYSKKRQ